MINDGSIGSRRERWIAIAILCGLVLWRTSIFLIWPQSHFNSDQAVFGLMAKHISEGRALPLFMYGQSYILAVEAWMPAPLFWVFGASATLLKLPLLFVNLAVGLLLLRQLEREAGLRPLAALVPILFFALPPPGTAAFLLEASGGNLEPFLYVLVLWMTRSRPHVSGLVLGVAFLHREFSIYGLAALLVIEAADRTLFTRGGIVRRLNTVRTAAEVWLLVQLAKPFASAAGPGTSLADVYSAPNNLVELLNRTCVNPASLLTGLTQLVSFHWPRLFGAYPEALAGFSIESATRQGLPGAWLLFLLTFAVALAGIVAGLARHRWRREYAFCVYLILVGAFSVIGYVAGRCGVLTQGTMRYELLSILGAVGVGALFLCVAPSRRIKAVWTALAVACAAVAASGHARLSYEYAVNRPVGQKELLVRHVTARGIEYGYSDYWIAYYVTFITNERTILASTDFVRVKSYESIVAANRDKAVRIARDMCEGGRHLTEFFFLCQP